MQEKAKVDDFSKNADQQLNPREKILASRSIPWLVISFSIPTIFSMLVTAIYNVVDRFWIGKMSNSIQAMAGIGITLPISIISFSFMALIGIGSTSLISIKLGQKDHQAAEDILGNCAFASFVVGTIITVIGLFFSQPLLSILGATPESLPFAWNYLSILILFNTFNTIAFTMSAVMRGVGNPVWSVMIQVVGTVINIILDPIFIFKPNELELFGQRLTIGLGLGIKGAAIATVIAQMVSFGLVTYYYLGKKSPVLFKRKALKPKKQVLKEIISIGSSSFALQAAASLVVIVANLQLARLGSDTAVSAMALLNSISMLGIMPIIGINQGIQPIIGYNYGAQKYRRVRATYFFAVGFASAIAVSFSLLIQFFPREIIGLFSEEKELVDVASHALKILMFMMPFLGYQIVSANYFQFVGKAFVALGMTLLRQIILLIPLYIILPIFFGTTGIWLASPISDGVAILITTVVFGKELLWLSKEIKRKEGALCHQ